MTKNPSAAAQELFARFLVDPEVEASVRGDPARAAIEHGVAIETTRRMAAIDPGRVTAFRASAAHKEAVRRGRKPRRIG